MPSFVVNRNPVLLVGTASAMPAATKLPIGSLYVATDVTPVAFYCVKITGTTKSWVASTTVATANNYYYGGTVVPQTTKAINFTASNLVSSYNLTADSLTIGLDTTADPIGQTYEFWSTTGTASPGHIFQPTTGTINGASTASFSRQYGAQVVKKTGATTWVMGQ